MGMTLLQNDMIHINDSLTLKTNTKGEKCQLNWSYLTYYNKNKVSRVLHYLNSTQFSNIFKPFKVSFIFAESIYFTQQDKSHLFQVHFSCRENEIAVAMAILYMTFHFK